MDWLLVAGTQAATASVRDTTQFVVTATGPGGQATDAAMVYDYPGFLTGHTFTLAAPAPIPANFSDYYMILHETLTFNDDHTGTFAMSIETNAPMAGGWIPTMPIVWQLKGDTATVAPPTGSTVCAVRIAGGQLIYSQPLKEPMGLDRQGHTFTATPR